MSWNIRQGGGTRVEGIIRAVRQMNPHILILSEFRNNERGSTIRNKLLQLGFIFQSVSAAHPSENSVLIASKFPGNTQLYAYQDYDYKHNMLRYDLEAFNIIGVYLPHKKKHKLFDLIQSQTDGIPKPFIIAGDFNTGKNFVDQKGDSFWYTSELKALEDSGYKDAFRLINNDVEEYSWYSHQRNGYRYDHTYVHEDLEPIIKNCYYEHQYREEKLSDHSPMVLELGV